MEIRARKTTFYNSKNRCFLSVYYYYTVYQMNIYEEGPLPIPRTSGGEEEEEEKSKDVFFLFLLPGSMLHATFNASLLS